MAIRFKKSSPYNSIKNKKYRLDRSKTNHDLVYWSIQKNNRYFSSMKQKILFELNRIKKNKFLYNLRKTYINRYYKGIKYGENI